MATLICGSLAYDTIMVFRDHFRNHILPEQVHILNVSFLVPEMRREFGGCAGNIAYGLKLLGGQPLLMGTVGTDFAPYAGWLDRNGISRRHVTEIAGTWTAQAFITTDLDDNQITAFHPGAMAHAHRNHVADADSVTLGIVSPDGREGMLRHVQEFAGAGIPFMLDPGQGLPMFAGGELLEMIGHASWIAVNDYECRLLLERTGITVQALAAQVRALIVTRGAEGSEVIHGGRTLALPAVPVAQPLDPTGCGDAYRAGLLYGIDRGFDWETTGRLAALMGAIKIRHPGTQNYRFQRDEFADLFRDHFGYRFDD